MKLRYLLVVASALLLAASLAPSPTRSAAPPAAGQIKLGTTSFYGLPSTETYTASVEIFNSTDCSGPGSGATVVQHIGQTPGHTFDLDATQSALLTVSPGEANAMSEQNGGFVNWQPADGTPVPTYLPGDGRQVCVQGVAAPGLYEYIARFAPGIEYFDSCGNERYEFRPGETITIKVTGGLKPEPSEPYRLQAAGGSVNECGWIPEAPAFTTVHVNSDPFVYTFTLPDSDADIPASCLASNSTHITGMWRTVTYDVPGCACNRADVRFQVQDGPPPPACPLTCPDDITAESAADSCGAAVSYTAPAGSTCDHPSGSVFPVGTTTVTCTGAGGSACEFDVTVTDHVNPSVTAPADITVGNDAGSCSASVDPGAATTDDNCAVQSVVGTRSDGQPLDAPYPVGTTNITWTATDVHGNTATDAQTVTVNDTEGPSITGASVSPGSLWPPNHKMRDVAVTYSAADNCGAAADCSITSVASNEPQNGTGDGDAAPDWEIVDAHHVRLRAERSGSGTGRVYTITITCTDAHGNASTKTVNVSVPHSK